jgi:molecular chaperone HscB
MHLEELRAQKKLGEDDPALLEEIGKAKLSLEEKHDVLLNELKVLWDEWDKFADGGVETETDSPERQKILAKMVDVLNRRNYIRNLLRDVNEAME